MRWETEGFVWKLSDSCQQHGLHQVDAYVWGWSNVTCDSRRFTQGFGWVEWCMSCAEWFFLSSLGCHSILIRVLPSVIFSCASTVNEFDLLFLRQCLIMPPPSTETSISGTSPELRICLIVSQYSYWRKTWRDVNSCYCDRRVQSGGWDWRWWCAMLVKLIWIKVSRYVYLRMTWRDARNWMDWWSDVIWTRLFQNSRGLVARRWCKGMQERVSSGERGGGGVDGEYVEKGRE